MKSWNGPIPVKQPSEFELFWYDTPFPVKIFIIVFALVAVAILSAIIYAVVKGIRQWASNNRSELLTVSCTAIAKRFEVSGGSGDTSASTSYYVTFELPNADRIELAVPGHSYGLIVEGDVGELTYQGTRFKAFQRTVDRDATR